VDVVEFPFFVVAFCILLFISYFLIFAYCGLNLVVVIMHYHFLMLSKGKYVWICIWICIMFGFMFSSMFSF